MITDIYNIVYGRLQLMQANVVMGTHTIWKEKKANFYTLCHCFIKYMISFYCFQGCAWLFNISPNPDKHLVDAQWNGMV